MDWDSCRKRSEVTWFDVVGDFADAVVVRAVRVVVIDGVINDVVRRVTRQIHFYRGRLRTLLIVAHRQPAPVAVVEHIDRPARAIGRRTDDVGRRVRSGFVPMPFNALTLL